MNHTLIEQLKSQLSFLRKEWKQEDEAREYALADMMTLDDDDPDMAFALCEFESAEIRLEEIEDDILDLEFQIKEEEEKA